MGSYCRKVGIYGGTFDPIHIGHVNIAISLMEAHNLDEVLFIPAWCSPFKQEATVSLAQHRVNMLHLALENAPKCHVLMSEIERKGISFTIDTLKEIQSKSSNDTQLYLLMGQDCIARFANWRAVDEIIDIAQPLVARRAPSLGEGELTSNGIAGKLKDALLAGMTQTPLFDVSASLIRSRIRQGLFCGHLVDRQVWQYIRNNSLYI